MASVFKKGRKWWMRLKGYNGRDGWSNAPTPYLATDETKSDALRYATRAQEILDGSRSKPGPITVADYAERWLTARAGRGIVSVADDRSRIKNHVLPTLGPMKMRDVGIPHVRDLIRALRSNPDLAARTVLHVYSLLRIMFAEAVVDGIIPTSPCATKPGDLPSKDDKDPEWRELATYTTAEVRLIVTSPIVPVERRVQYALKSLAGLRHGEAAGLRWRDRLPAEPLPKLAVSKSYERKGTKTKVARPIPEHPTLTAILDRWRTEHWPRIYGREPTPDDYIVPTRTMRPVDGHDAVNAFKSDLRALGLRVEAGEHRARGGHDLRAWFISTALEAGASIEILRRVTHTKRKDVVSGYTRLPWPAVCAEVAKLPFVVDGDPLELATDHATREQVVSARWNNCDPNGIRTRVKYAELFTRDSVSGEFSSSLATSCDASLIALGRRLATGSDEP